MENKKSISCEDINGVKPFNCCSSCHEEWDQENREPIEIYPEPNRNGVESSAVAFVCCSCPTLTRDDFAMILRRKRIVDE